MPAENEIKEEAILINDDDTDDICELEHLRKLFIGGLSPITTEQSLKKFYEKWGKVVDVVVMRDPNTKRSRGFGFITYTKSSMVDEAQANRPHVIDEKTVEAKRALPRPEKETRENNNLTVKKLFVGGLKDNHDEDCLREYFSQFGNVVSVKILTDRTTQKRRGFAFIEYDDYDAVDKAMLKKTHCLKYVVIDVKKSIYSQERGHRQAMSGENEDNDNSSGRMLGMQGNNGRKSSAPQQVYPKVQPYQPYQRPPQPPNGYPQAPPTYNWGPPAPQYGYQQPPPPQPPMNNWNYPPAPNGWNSGPPPPANGWGAQPNQWGGCPAPPPNVPGVPNVPVPGGWNAPPVVAPPPPPGVVRPPVPPQAAWNGPPGPIPPQVPPPGTPMAAPIVPPPNFGAGYQQSYGGGPAKHNMNASRPRPYGPPPVANGYVNAGPPPGTTGPIPKPINGALPVPPVGKNYRR